MRQRVWPLVLALFLAAPAWGVDQVNLENGDVVRGTVEKMLDGKLHFTQLYGTAMELPFEKVTALATESQLKVELVDGTVVLGTAQASEDPTQVVLVTEALEQVSVTKEKIAAINRPEEKPARWSARLAAGISITDGNTKTTSMWGVFTGKRESKNDRITLELSGYYAEENGEETQKEETANLQYDYYIIQDLLYVWARLHFHHDSFEELNLRTRIGIGLGWQAIKNDWTDLRFEAGVSYVNEDYKAPIEDEEGVSPRLALRWEQKIIENLSLSEFLEVFPGETFVHNETYLNVAVWEGFSLQLGFIWDHDTDPPDGLERNDFKYLLSLAYTFG